MAELADVLDAGDAPWLPSPLPLQPATIAAAANTIVLAQFVRMAP